MSRPQPPPKAVPRPRVADSDRRRARKACTYCQRRKSKCIESETGACIKCKRHGVSCSLQYVGHTFSSPLPEETECLALETPNLSLDTQDSNVQSTTTANSTNIPDLVVEDLSATCLLDRIRRTMFLGDSSPSTPAEPPKRPKDNLDAPFLRSTKDVFPPRHIAEFLVDICIDYGTDFMFYFPQTQFKRRIHEFYSNPDSQLRSSVSFLSMALSSFAIGTQFAHLADPRLVTAEPSSTHIQAGARFYNAACALIPYLICHPSVEGVQALTMLSIYMFPFDARGVSYLYLGLALRMSVSIGLHLNTEAEFTEVEREIRNRTWWTVFVTERITTIKLGLPEGFSENTVSTPLPQQCWALDQGQIHDNLEVLSAYISFVRIWRAISQAVPSLFRTHTPANIQEINRLLCQLEEWKECLPASLDVQHIDQRSKLYRSVAHLHANFHHAWIILAREPLIGLVKSTMEKAVRASNPSPSLPEHINHFPELCHEAARSMIALYATLLKADALARFSFTDFQGCSTAAIVILLYGIIDRNQSYQYDIDSALSALSFMAAGNDRAGKALQFIYNFQKLTDEAFDRVHSTTSVTSVTHEVYSRDKDALNSYGNWLAAWRDPQRASHQPSFTPIDFIPPAHPSSDEGLDSTTHAFHENEVGGNDTVASENSAASTVWRDENSPSSWMHETSDGFGIDGFGTFTFAGSSSMPDTFVADLTGVNLLELGF